MGMSPFCSLVNDYLLLLMLFLNLIIKYGSFDLQDLSWNGIFGTSSCGSRLCIFYTSFLTIKQLKIPNDAKFSNEF